MDVEQFVSDVLKQVSSAVNAVDKSVIDFEVDPAKGISFSLAVTTTNSSENNKGAAGGVKVKVIDAGINKKMTVKESRETTSRIEFTVKMYKKQSEAGVVTSEPFLNNFDI